MGCVLLGAQGFARIHLSPNGSDGNPGTQERPVRTLERALALAGGSKQKATGDVTILLAGGKRKRASGKGRRKHSLRLAPRQP